jgi:hypothetical protein
MCFRKTLSNFWANVHGILFPELECSLGELSETHKKLIAVLELIRIEEFLPSTRFNMGRPITQQADIARAFIAKIVFNIPYTKHLIRLLKVDKKLAGICGFDPYKKIPSESKFSRMWKNFADTKLPEKVHQALISKVYKDKIIGHLVIDSVPVEVREKPLKKAPAKERKKLRQKAKKKGELNRREKQLLEPDLNKIIESLPNKCDKGMKRSASGYTEIWTGYKEHVAVDDNCVPIAAILTSASLNDCEVAIPLLSKANKVTKNFYDLMDAAYDHPEIKQHSTALGHVPLIDKCPHGTQEKLDKETKKLGQKKLKFYPADVVRYKQRFPKERFNALFKDYHGGRNIIYRGFSKVSCHVMFGVLTLAAATLIKLIQ